MKVKNTENIEKTRSQASGKEMKNRPYDWQEKEASEKEKILEKKTSEER